jgi:tripartite-type tricarboxylate transporter receptor subunit TctC
VQYVPQRHPDLAHVPTALDVATTQEGRDIMAFFVSGAQVGRSIVAPPGVPPERVKLLRAAFDAMLADHELLAEIEKTGLEFAPASGEALQKIIEATANARPEVVARTQAILRGR